MGICRKTQYFQTEVQGKGFEKASIWIKFWRIYGMPRDEPLGLAMTSVMYKILFPLWWESKVSPACTRCAFLLGTGPADSRCSFALRIDHGLNIADEMQRLPLLALEQVTRLPQFLLVLFLRVIPSLIFLNQQLLPIHNPAKVQPCPSSVHSERMDFNFIHFSPLGLTLVHNSMGHSFILQREMRLGGLNNLPCFPQLISENPDTGLGV